MRAIMKAAFIIAIAPLAAAAETTFHDRAGRVTGKARTDANGIVHFYDPAGRVTGTARTDTNGAHIFYDQAGRVRGKAK